MKKPEYYWSRLIARMEPVVFFGSAALVVGFCLLGGLFTDFASQFFTRLQQSIVVNFGWYYAPVVSLQLVVSLWLLLGRYRTVRLGPEDSRPGFSYISWFAMLFSAGMGTGIVFWSVAEPLYH